MPELSPLALRAQIRSGSFTGHTSGLASGFVQCNLAILSGDWANDFLQFCQRNPKPCPLLSMSNSPGDYTLPSLGQDIDIRTDIPRYRLWRDGVLSGEAGDIIDIWQDDMVAFLLGCSFSFEEALIADGIDVRNISEAVNVPMYRTNIDCVPAGRFNAKTVVSMRPMKAADAIRAVQICSRFPAVHGAPIHIGDPSLIGISNINKTDFGEAVTIHDDELPVFWACGVTPQVAIETAAPTLSISHSPGHMLVTDLKNCKLAAL